MADDMITAAINASRIPDTIKLLPMYEGDPKTLKNWLDTVESILNLYRPLRGNQIYNFILNRKLQAKLPTHYNVQPLIGMKLNKP